MVHFIYLTLIVVSLSSCGYRMGRGDRSLPGGYEQVHIPLFKNRTMEPGIEVAFTDAFIRKMSAAGTGRVVPPELAETILQGEVLQLQYQPDGEVSGENLPIGVVIASQYRILVTVRYTLLRSANRETLWTADFVGEGAYYAPRVQTGGINTVNPLYNLSARRQNIATIAQDLAVEAHDRMTENF